MIQTSVVQGKLWLFPDSSPQGVEASKHVEPAIVPGLDLVCMVLCLAIPFVRYVHLEAAEGRSAAICCLFTSAAPLFPFSVRVLFT